MKRWKSLIIVALALILAFQVGCSSSGGGSSAGDSKDVVKLKFWDFHTEKEKKFFQDLVKEYNASHDNVEIKYSSMNQSDYGTKKLPVAFANGEGPDIFMVNPGNFLKFAKAGILADLNSYFPDGAKDDFQSSAIKDVTYDDKVLALPFELELLGLYYNKKMLKDAGVEVPKTWDELLAAAKKLNTDKVSGLVLPTDKNTYLNFVWYPFLWEQGGSVMNEDKTKSNFNSPEVVKALNYWGEFFKEGVSPSKLQMDPTDIGNIGTKKTAMQICGTWAIPLLESKYSDVPVGLAPIPVPDGGEPATAAGGYKLAVNSKSEHVKEAADFVMWAFAGDKSRPLKWSTEVKFAYPARKSVVKEGKKFYNKGLRKVFTQKIYDTARPEPSFNTETVDIISDALQSVSFGNTSGEKVAKDADRKIEESLNQK